MRTVATVLIAVLALSCGIPRDPDGTLDRVSDGTMRVGIVHAEPWAIVDDRAPAGIEPSLVERFAASIRAEITWIEGSEQELLTALEEGEIDLVIGGLVASNPWSGRVTFTRPYVTHADGEHVFAIRHGENAWLSAIERSLDHQRDAVPTLLESSET